MAGRAPLARKRGLSYGHIEGVYWALIVQAYCWIPAFAGKTRIYGGIHCVHSALQQMVPPDKPGRAAEQAGDDENGEGGRAPLAPTVSRHNSIIHIYVVCPVMDSPD